MPGWVVFAVVAVNLGLIYLLLAARLGVRTISHGIRIAAPAGRVWSALAPLGENAGWSGEVRAARRLQDGLVRETLHWEGRDGRPIERTVDFRSSADGSGYVMRVVEDSSLDASFWAAFVEEARLRQEGATTWVSVRQTDRYRGLAFLAFRYFALRRRLAKLKTWCETGVYRSGGWFEHPLTQLGLACVSVLLLWPLAGFTAGGLAFAIMMTTVVALHELGHMAAFRVAGHRSARMIFVPLLGGIALGGRPYDSRFEVAFVALMGAGFSAFLVPPLMALSEAVGVSGNLHGRNFFAALVGCIALFNLANLVPVWKFDGGQVLRQIAPAPLAQAALSFLILAAFLLVGHAAGFPGPLLVVAGAVFALLGLITAGSGVKPREELKPASRFGRVALGAGLLSVMAIHATGVWWAFTSLG